MEKRAAVLALALTLPLLLYGIPYAHAAVTTSDYVVEGILLVQTNTFASNHTDCRHGDYAISGGYLPPEESNGAYPPSQPIIYASYPTVGGVPTTNGQTPDGWGFAGNNQDLDRTARIWVVCQSPITVAGVTVPEFGSLYVAIAFGAVVYFMLSRHFTRRPALPAQA